MGETPSLATHNATIAAQDGNQTSPFMLQYHDAYNGTPGWSFSISKSDTAGTGIWNAYASGATAGTWTHLAGTYDATTQTAELYVSGTLAATATGAASWSSSGASLSAEAGAAGRPTSPGRAGRVM